MSSHFSNSERLPKFVLDSKRRLSTKAAYKLTAWLFEHRNQATDVSTISHAIRVPVNYVRTMCRQLEILDILAEEPLLSLQYRYNVNCWDVELQAAIESLLIDSDVDGLPEFPARRG